MPGWRIRSCEEIAAKTLQDEGSGDMDVRVDDNQCHYELAIHTRPVSEAGKEDVGSAWTE